jgi:hypothetical protein
MLKLTQSQAAMPNVGENTLYIRRYIASNNSSLFKRRFLDWVACKFSSKKYSNYPIATRLIFLSVTWMNNAKESYTWATNIAATKGTCIGACLVICM